ncbi:glucosamine-6-phosphate deaminase [uncultured Clostridium sp.]|uniref:glucosamine-6-phosphate deaminase n=1 Tax=uncultured Clostridium sp. TaxID=59620 RepID=UPI0028EB25A8|nr:glucosamine-6-phosphate deaminase [uncultured Clostridium sp.]
MKIIKVKDYKELSRKASNILASQLILKPKSVLGLATGSTPIGTYEELIHLYNEGVISFSNVITFNLDEYCGLKSNDINSYCNFMKTKLFNHVDIREENIHIPNGVTKDIQKECEDYEKEIKKFGGIDIQLLGIGKNGHIGFNEPNLKFQSKTFLVNLDEDTIKANSRFFNSIEDVPRQAISMGIKTIMNSKKILLLANGEEKGEILYRAIYGDIIPQVPASILQLHPDVTIIVDEKAGSCLK